MSLSNRSNETSSPIGTADISYRFATMQDISTLSTLAIETYKQTYESALPYYTNEVLEILFGKSYREDVLPKELNDPKYQYFICENAGKAMGYAKLEFKARKAYLDKLYFLQESHAKGCGHHMLQACFQSAVDHGFKKMTLNVWTENNKAIRFYQQHGFQRGRAHVFFLFGENKEDGADLKMTCPDITPYLDYALPKLK